jgi:putative transposase
MADDLRRPLSITEVCALYGVSRQTGDTWIERSLTSGPPGLEDRSRTPCSRPHQTPQHVVEAIIEVRCRHPSWGAKTRLSIVHTRHPRGALPGRSTAGDILRRRGVVPKKRHRRPIGHPGQPTTLIAAPHEGWSAEVTGQCHTGDGLYWYPLTVADGDRRVLLGCQALSSTRVAEAKPVFTRLFKAFGWPKRIRTDHGVPLATNTLGRLSPLSAWWVRLGIFPELIEPGTPQQNGRHDRRHRTLKAETTRPPARTRRAQQRTFDRFREECHCQRPQEALDRQPPASRYDPSPRQRPHSWPPLEDPDRFEVRESVPTGAFVGTIQGATLHIPAWAQMSASKTSTRASGMSPSARSHLAGCSNDTGASKLSMGDSHDTGDGDPCLRTIL